MKMENNTPLVVVTAKVAAAGLVLASCGFGAVYAFSVGIHGGKLLAGLTIGFAVALELMKPLAIAKALDAFRSWSLVRGLLLLSLGLVAVAYSLSAELSLMASTRGDLQAERSKVTESQTIARERYQRAKDELSSLKPSRPVEELKALVARTSGRDCAFVNGSMRQVCEPSPHAQELARAKRRAELEAILLEAGGTVTQGASVAEADPGASSLAIYLAALGVAIPAAVLSKWLTLVPVLAMELGSSLAGVLVAAFPKTTQGVSYAPQIPQLEKDRAAQKLLVHLQSNGGHAKGSHKALGAAIGMDKSTVGRAIHALAAGGLIALEASRSGSMLRLIG